MRKFVSLLTFLLLFTTMGWSQGKISGTVRDQNGDNIPFATINVKGTKVSVAADANANFSIPAKAGDVLVVTAVGVQTTEFTVGNSATVSVIVTRTTGNITDVVVTTALGIQRNRNTLPYAAQQVNGDEVSKTNNLNPVSSLSGKVAGLQITQSNTMGGSTNVILRGVKSLTQSNQALFVVDGVPYDNSNQSRSSFDLGNVATDLNGDDIASITVLKGAAASALYGARASNGVIMITTKKSKSGGIHSSVSFGLMTGSPDNSTLPTYQTEYGQGYDPSFDANTVPIFNSNGQPVPVVETYADAATGPKYDPSMMVYNWDAFMPGDPNYGKATPWQPAKHNRPQDYFVTPISTTTNVSVYGNDQYGDFKLVYQRGADKDFMPNSHLKKNDLTLAANREVVKNLSIGADFTYSNNTATNRYLYPYTGGTSPMTDFRQWWPTNVDIDQLRNDYFNANPGHATNATWNWQTGAYLGNTSIDDIGIAAYHDNLYWYSYTNFENDSRERYFGNVHINYKLGSLLNILGRVSKDYYDQAFETRTDVGSQGTPGYTRYNGSHNETNYDLQINLVKDLTPDLNLTALLGGNVRQQLDQYLQASTNGGLVVAGVFALSNSLKSIAAPTESYGEREIYGAFAQATLSYKQIINLDGSIRRDESSTLPKGNNIFWYPNASLNFQFGKLLSNLTWLSHGKIWGNYAQVGSDAPIFSVYNTYTGLSPFNGQPLTSLSSTNNNINLLPETQKGWETGIEASFLKERLGFSVTYYSAKQVNQITPITVSTTTGYTNFFVNGGTLQNSGFEIQLNLVPVQTKNFSWNMVVNWSNNKQKVVSLYNDQPSYVVASYQNALRLTAVPGKSYQLQGTDYVYNDKGERIIDENGYYEIASNAYSNLGTPFPDWRGGINNSFRYKNFALSFLVDVSKGGSVYSLDMDYGSGSGLYPRTAGLNDLGNSVRAPLTTDSKSGGIILAGVTEDGKPNTVRIDESDIDNGAWSYSSAYGEADREFVYDASYVKLRELALSYSIPKKAFTNVRFIKGIDLSIIGRNLWIIHKNEPYADPEQGQASGNASMGFQNGAYPTIRDIGFNVRLSF